MAGQSASLRGVGSAEKGGIMLTGRNRQARSYARRHGVCRRVRFIRMSHRLALALAILPAGLLVLLSAGAATPPPTFTTLAPGQVPRIEQNLDVNVVFIGFHTGSGPQQIDDSRFRSRLTPFSAVAAAEISAVQGTPRIRPGILSHLDYNIVYAPPWFEDAFFGFLSELAQPQAFSISFGPGTPELPVVPAQYFYDFCNAPQALFGCDFDPSAPRTNRRLITQNHFIYAPLVEKVLDYNLPSIGVDPSRPTLVLINWFGRPDFIDHAYFKGNGPDVETGFNYLFKGVVFSGLTSGWGGTAPDDPEDSGLCPGPCPLARVMFLDLSAGPTIRQGDWDLISPAYRLTFNCCFFDYRLPPIWEYGNIGYRPFNDLTGDLAEKVVSDVFIGAVATANPLYPPVLSPPRTPATIQLDVNLFQWNPPVDTSNLLKRDVLVRILSELPYRFTTEFTKVASGGDRRLRQVYDCYRSAFDDPLGVGQSCYGNRLGGSAQGDLYLYFRDHLFHFLEGDPDYELPVFIFDTDNAHQVPYVGFADSNYADNPRQSFVYLASRPDTISGSEFSLTSAYGYTRTLAHEAGHHVGLSHPFLGYRCLDPECQNLRFFNALGDTYYTWLGDQVNSVMNLNFLNQDFSQFDRDNVRRWLTFEYLRLANEILPSVLSSPRAGQVSSALQAADGLATNALAAFGAVDYTGAVQSAEGAYRTVLGAADQIGVPIDAAAWQRGYRHPPDVRRDLREAIKRMLTDDLGEQDQQAALTRLLNGATLTIPNWGLLPKAPTSAPIPVFSRSPRPL